MNERPLRKRKLVLFDIDGTLILYRGREPYRIFEDMAREFFDTTISLDHYRFSGKTDKAIIHEVLAIGGISESDIAAREPELFEWMALQLEERTTAATFHLLPKVNELLDRIDDSVTKALLTGNVERCAAIKLSHFDLLRHFEFGVYGTASKNRNDLGPLAVEKYRELFDEAIDPADIVVIGDTVNDVQVAKHIGAKVIVTLTGRSTREEIVPHEPDHIFNDLSDTDAVLAAIYQ
jgi:phosphoglycolate phosphatase